MGRLVAFLVVGVVLVGCASAPQRTMNSIGPFPENLSAVRLFNALGAHAEGDDAALLGLNGFAGVGRGDSGDPRVFSAGMNVATGCTDGPLPWDPTATVDEREQQLADAIAALPADSFEPFTKEAWMEWWQPGGCLDWPAPDRLDPVLPTGTTTIDLPALVLSGEQDNIVPEHVTRGLLDIFPNSTFAPINDAVHNVMGWSQCPRDLVTSFINTLHVDGQTCAPGQ